MAVDNGMSPASDATASSPKKIWSVRGAGWIVSGRWIGLLLGILLLVLAWTSTATSPVARSVDQLFGSSDPSVTDYQQIKAIFGDRETVLVVYPDPNLFAPDGNGLERLSQLSAQVNALDQVEEVLSLDRLEQTLRLISPLVYPTSTAKWTLLDPHNEIAALMIETFDGWTHRRENDLAVLVCLLASPTAQSDPNRTRDTIRQLRELVSEIPDAHVVGEPVMVEDAFEYLQRDGQWLQFGAVVLLGLVILLVMRTVKWLLVAAAIVVWSNAITTWLLALLSFQQSMVSSLLGSIIAVIGVATTIHLVVTYRIRRAHGESRTQAMRTTMERLLPPVFWACLTDAAGFAALSIAHVSAVREFGLMMSLASLVTLVAVCLLAPGLILLGPRDFVANTGLGQARLESTLRNILRHVRRHPGFVCSVTLLASLVASAGFYWAKVETDFTKNFRDNTPIMEGYHFTEREFGGAGLIEIAVPTPRVLDRQFVQNVEDFQNTLRRIPTVADSNGEESVAEITSPTALAKVISIVDILQATRTFAAVRLLPTDAVVGIMRQALPEFTNHWYQWDSQKRTGYVRIFARTKQQQSAQQKRRLIEAIQNAAESHFGQQVANPGETRWRDRGSASTPPDIDALSVPPPQVPAQPKYLVSGLFVLLSRIVDSLLADHLATTATAILAIGGLMYLALFRIRLVLIGLVPNLLPIFVVLGCLGWSGTPINMGVAMIAAVSIGLSVDSSIHYLWAVANPSQETNSSDEYAVVDWAQTRIGTALTYSSVALVVGFVSLTRSEFVPTIYFGGLVSAAMVGGLFGNVILLPALLTLRTPRFLCRNRKT